jgi:hypothetical protein
MTVTGHFCQRRFDLHVVRRRPSAMSGAPNSLAYPWTTDRCRGHAAGSPDLLTRASDTRQSAVLNILCAVGGLRR